MEQLPDTSDHHIGCEPICAVVPLPSALIIPGINAQQDCLQCLLQLPYMQAREGTQCGYVHCVAVAKICV